MEQIQEKAIEGQVELYYADGSSFSLVPSVPYAWQKIGERIELPCFRGKTLSLFGIWDAKKDLHLYSSENSIGSEAIVAFVDDFIKTLSGLAIIVFDNAPVHTSKLFEKKEREWQQKGLHIFKLPTYSPHLNLIEHLWRFMKYEWIAFDAYDSWGNLVKYVEGIDREFGNEYTINFV